MRAILEWAGELVGRFSKRALELASFGLKAPDDVERSEGDRDDHQDRSPVGCLIAAVIALGIGAGLALLILRSGPTGDDTVADGDPDTPAGQTDQVDIANGNPDDGSVFAAGWFTDPTYPTWLIPAAGDWSTDNGMFVPNCGPDDPEPETAIDVGTVDVWESGAVLELRGPEGESLVFERTGTSAESATYAGGVGFVEIELVFSSPDAFDATITYGGDNQCVRRSASGTLAAGDDDRQHREEQFPESTTPDVGIDQAAEGTIGVVTIGEDRWEFFPVGPLGTCDDDFFGGFTAVLYSEGFVNSLNVDLVPDGSRVSTVTMKLQGEDLDLVADEEAEWAAVEPGTSAVLDYEIDGPTATGRVSFINEDRAFNAANFPLDPIEATFTVICGS